MILLVLTLLDLQVAKLLPPFRMGYSTRARSHTRRTGLEPKPENSKKSAHRRNTHSKVHTYSRQRKRKTRSHHKIEKEDYNRASSMFHRTKSNLFISSSARPFSVSALRWAHCLRRRKSSQATMHNSNSRRSHQRSGTTIPFRPFSAHCSNCWKRARFVRLGVRKWSISSVC